MMDAVPYARTHTRTISGENDPRGGGRDDLQVYPNRCGKPRDDDNRGALRVGMVEENEDMEARKLAGHVAAVTHEEHGEARFYIWQICAWVGPFWALSEEIVSME